MSSTHLGTAGHDQPFDTTLLGDDDVESGLMIGSMIELIQRRRTGRDAERRGHRQPWDQDQLRDEVGHLSRAALKATVLPVDYYRIGYRLVWPLPVDARPDRFPAELPGIPRFSLADLDRLGIGGAMGGAAQSGPAWRRRIGIRLRRCWRRGAEPTGRMVLVRGQRQPAGPG